MTQQLQAALDFAQDIPIKEFNKALNLLDRKEFDKALLLLNKVRRIKEFKELLLNIGVAYKGKNNIPKAIEFFKKSTDPLLPLSNAMFFDRTLLAMAYSNIGLAHFALEEDDKALEWYEKALQIDNDYNDARWNKSLVYLRKYCSNQYDDPGKAWRLYTYRFKRSSPTKLHNDRYDVDIWNYKLKGDGIAVMMEQGIGDTFMFGRYIPLLEEYFGNNIWIQTTPDVATALDYKTCQSVKELPISHLIPIGSLPIMSPNEIPAGDWLKHKYKPKTYNGVPEILCIWSGNPEHANAHNRDAPAILFDRFKKYGNLHSAVSRKGYTKMPIVDWKTTIEYLENIDIVITVDSSMSHLCGALGKPCIVLMPLLDGDFRWGNKSMGLENKWYNTVKVIRNPMNWATTMNTAENYLSEVLTTFKTGDMIKL